MTLSYRHELVTIPIASALEERGWSVRAVEDPAADLIAGSADVALAPALDYARHVGVVDYSLVPGVGIVADGISGLLTLAFNRGLERLDRVAVRHIDGAEAVFARILFAEKHGLEPELLAAGRNESLESMLSRADGALLVGDDAVLGPHEGSLFDLSDEWQDLTESPMPYMLAWGRTGEIDDESLAVLRAACEAAPRLLPAIASERGRGGLALAERVLSGAVRYALEPNDLVGVDNLFRLAFFHGAVSDVASIKYLPEGDPAEIPDTSSE